MDYVQNRNAEKIEKMCSQGLDPNFHDSQGDSPLTLASGIANSREVLVQLVGGGAHLDFRNSEGQVRDEIFIYFFVMILFRPECIKRRFCRLWIM